MSNLAQEDAGALAKMSTSVLIRNYNEENWLFISRRDFKLLDRQNNIMCPQFSCTVHVTAFRDRPLCSLSTIITR